MGVKGCLFKFVLLATCNLISMAVQLSTQTFSSTLTNTTSELSLFGLSFEHLTKPNTKLAIRRRWSQFNPSLPLPSLEAMFAHKIIFIPPFSKFLLLGAVCASSEVRSPRRVEEYWRGVGRHRAPPAPAAQPRPGGATTKMMLLRLYCNHCDFFCQKWKI